MKINVKKSLIEMAESYLLHFFTRASLAGADAATEAYDRTLVDCPGRLSLSLDDCPASSSF